MSVFTKYELFPLYHYETAHKNHPAGYGGYAWRWSGFVIYGGSDTPYNPGKRIIRLAEQYAGKIHLLVTDVVMPGMNGRDLAAKLTTDYPDLRCLFMSGYTANVIAHHGVLDKGFNFIQKPFSVKDLATKVREALDAG